MALLTIAAGGIIGSWAFRAGNAVSASIMLAEQRKREEIQRKETMRLIKNARRRELYAEKRAAEIAAREAAAQGGMLLLANGATDQAVLEAPTKPQRKRRAQSAVPLVAATTFRA
uniref:hypothetical protein n=1 Tax=Methylobacterium sp. B34 TaxID=95563 RepID=UPI001955466C